MEKKMKLGEALTLLKSKKSRLAQLQSKRYEQFYVDIGKKPAFTYQDLTDQIKAESKDIVRLKLAIQEANLRNRTTGGRSIAEAIIKIGELRSALANLGNIMEKEPTKRLTWDSDKSIEQYPQVDLKEVDAVIQKLTAEKAEIDNGLQNANWKVDVSVELS